MYFGGSYVVIYNLRAIELYAKNLFSSIFLSPSDLGGRNEQV